MSLCPFSTLALHKQANERTRIPICSPVLCFSLDKQSHSNQPSQIEISMFNVYIVSQVVVYLLACVRIRDYTSINQTISSFRDPQEPKSNWPKNTRCNAENAEVTQLIQANTSFRRERLYRHTATFRFRSFLHYQITTFFSEKSKVLSENTGKPPHAFQILLREMQNRCAIMQTKPTLIKGSKEDTWDDRKAVSVVELEW